MKRISLFATVLLIASLALAASSAPVAQTVSAGALPAPTATVNAPAAVTAPITNGSLAGIESTLENIYQQVNPSVVAIQVLQQQTSVGQGFPSLPGLPFFGGPQSQAPQQQFQSALGSGFVWDKQGDIVTNNHVVDGATKISVVFSDGTTVPGKVIGTDVNSDLAVVKVDVPADKLQPVAVADSTQAKVGQLSIAIGNPFGEQNTMTVGFVSA